jgi:hypothetical protein
MLFRRKVTLTDARELFVNATSTLGGGFIIPGVSANGFRLSAADAPEIPQSAIWTQYAEMFEFYQVTRVHMHIIPYKNEFDF